MSQKIIKYTIDPYGVKCDYEDNPDGSIILAPSYCLNQLTYIPLPILDGKYFVNKRISNYLLSCLRDIENSPYKRFVKTIKTWEPKHIDHDLNKPLSTHTFGIALDLNQEWNTKVNNQNLNVVKIFKKYGFKWQGDVKGGNYAHFEVV